MGLDDCKTNLLWFVAGDLPMQKRGWGVLVNRGKHGTIGWNKSQHLCHRCLFMSKPKSLFTPKITNRWGWSATSETFCKRQWGVLGRPLIRVTGTLKTLSCD